LEVGSEKSEVGVRVAVQRGMALESFSDRSFRFSVNLVRFYRDISRPSIDVPRSLAHQMLRAGTAVGANIAEARSASTRRELAAKYAIGLREARECHYWLRLIVADRPQLAPSTDQLLDECNQLIALLTTTVKKLRG
jgi:four helix bundle protein